MSIEPFVCPGPGSTELQSCDKHVNKIVIGGLEDEDEKRATLSNNEAERLLDLPELTHLYLWNCAELTTLPDLSGTNLEVLDVRGCEDLETLAGLPASLKTLDVQGCARLENVVFTPCDALEYLYFGDNPAIDPDHIEAVVRTNKQLRELQLDKLPGLSSIEISSKLLGRLWIRHCTTLKTLEGLPGGLVTLNLEGCTSLGVLPVLPQSLTFCSLSGCNSITSLARLSDCINLLTLEARDIVAEKLEYGPVENLLDNLRALYLYGSQFNDLRVEHLGNNKEENVLQLLRDRKRIGERGLVDCRAAKVILLGEGGAGKTQMLRALQGAPFDDESDPTHGARIEKLNGFKHYPVTVWDLGGQDDYLNTHRLFMKSRAVFIVVWRAGEWDRRGNVERKPCEYWVQQVVNAQPGAQVILLQTGMDQDKEAEDWEHHIPSHLNKQARTRSLEFSAIDGERGDYLPTLKKELEACITEMLGSEQSRLEPRFSDDVRQFIERAQEEDQWQTDVLDRSEFGPGHRNVHKYGLPRVIPREKFRELVQQIAAGIKEPGEHQLPEVGNCEQLLGWLRNIGSVLWLETSEHAQVVLDQRWFLKGIYDVFQWEMKRRLK